MTKLSASDVIAIASVVIAISALGTSLWQGYLTRKHNFLSVRPFLQFSFHRRPDTPLIIELKNDGVGPAVMHTITARINGDEFLVHTIQDLRKVLAYIFPPGARIDYAYGLFDSDTVLAAGKSINWLEVKFVDGIAEPQASHLALQVRLVLTICYSCIYQHRFTSEGKLGGHVA